jgi:hypothetical protein
MDHILRLRISGPTAVHGRKPGDEFEVACDGAGVPLQQEWRKRLADEARHAIGAVTVVICSAHEDLIAPVQEA